MRINASYIPGCLSLLLHLCLLFGMALVWHPLNVRQKQPSMYIPSYAYHEAPSAPASMQQQERAPKVEQQQASESPAINTAMQIKHASQPQSRTSTKVTEAINLIGDKKTTPKPLIKLLGKALTAHLVYPKIAVDFKVRGLAYVSFVIHPDGTVTNIELVQSSHAGVLDDEALSAVRAISPVKGASSYVPQAKQLVIGILFN